MDGVITTTLIQSGCVDVSPCDVNMEMPSRTPPFAGLQLITDMLTGNPDKGYHHFRMSNTMFFKLEELLVSRGLITNAQHITAQQQLAYFLYCVGHGVPNRVMTETFRHLGENISHDFNNVLKAICSLTQEFIALPCQGVDVHPYIRSNRRFYPYFQNAIGAVNAICFPAIIQESKQSCFRDWKGTTSQRVMVAASFDHSFLFVCTGWEGRTHNMEVLRWCVERGGFDVPEGKYYLVDEEEYANTEKFLTAYNRWDSFNTLCRRGRKYINSKDIFNHRHSQLRSCVDKALHILKKRFRILRSPIASPFRVQQRIILAYCVIHNFIRRYQQDDKYFDMILQSELLDTNEVDMCSYWPTEDYETPGGKKLRNVIARTTWRDYRDLDSDDEDRVIH